MSELRLIKSNEPGPPSLDSSDGCGCMALILFGAIAVVALLFKSLF